MDENKEEMIEKIEETAQEAAEETVEEIAEEVEEATEETAEEAVEEKAEEAPKKKLGVKGFIAGIVAACVVFGLVIGAVQINKNKNNDTANESAAEETEAMKAQLPDMDALFAPHDADEIVATVNGNGVTWAEYFYWLSYNINYNYSYMQMYYDYYGMNVDWNDAIDDSGMTYAQYIIETTASCIVQRHVIEDYAKEVGLEFTDEMQKELDEQIAEFKVQLCGEDADDAAFEAKLSEQHATADMLKAFIRADVIYDNLFAFVYGENGEKLPDADALKYLEDNGYVYHCTHILLLTKDMTTGEALSDEDKAAKKAQADELYAQLAAIEDHEELVKTFGEMKVEYCEDSGKEKYPDGYVFTAGQMVEVFEKTTEELEEYQLSEPVESDYGYHIILKLPADPDATVTFSQDGEAVNARLMASDEMFNERISGDITMAAENIVYADSMKDFTFVK